jgi:hypothetical protein
MLQEVISQKVMELEVNLYMKVAAMQTFLEISEMNHFWSILKLDCYPWQILARTRTGLFNNVSIIVLLSYRFCPQVAILRDSSGDSELEWKACCIWRSY